MGCIIYVVTIDASYLYYLVLSIFVVFSLLFVHIYNLRILENAGTIVVVNNQVDELPMYTADEGSIELPEYASNETYFST